MQGSGGSMKILIDFGLLDWSVGHEFVVLLLTFIFLSPVANH